MGFRCPVCHEDFGKDKKLWEKHCKEEHDGIAQDVLTWLKKTTCKESEKQNDK